MLKRNIILAFALTAISCTGIADHGRNEYEKEISFSAGFAVSVVPSKADLFDSDNILIVGDGGRKHGDFSVTAYKTGTEEKYFLKAERVYYMHYPESEEKSGWNLAHTNESGEIEFHKRYWPQTYALDFFAYMPYDLSDSHVKINYNEVSFTCDLPTDATGQDSAKEFVYAFSANQSPESVDATDDKVPVTFLHPLTAVRFKLGKAHGNTTINNVGFSGIYTKGEFTKPEDNTSQSDLTCEDWTPSGEKTSLNIEIGKNVPDDIQLGAYIGGTYLVLPQKFDENVMISVSFTWEGDNERQVALGAGKFWEPGKVYTYTLNLGDNEEDILADVSVEEWDVIGYDNIIDVE